MRLFRVIGFLYLACILQDVVALEKPDVDFLLDHPGISLSLSHNHVCTLSQRHNEDEIGGEAVCFGAHDTGHGHMQPPQDSTFVQIVVGEHFGCGLLLDQTVQCWGHFADLKVEGMFTQIVSSNLFGCGIMTDEQISCWGHLPRFEAPKSDIGFVQIDCSDLHCCALDKLAVPTCWGEFSSDHKDNHYLRPPKQKSVVTLDGISSSSTNEIEQEEDGYDDNDTNLMKGDNVQFKQISVTSMYSCGIKLDNSLLCWGKEKAFGGIIKDVLKDDGPFKTIAVGELGVCAIYGDTGYDENEDESESDGDGGGDGDGDGDEQRPKSNTLICWGRKAHGLYNRSKDEIMQHRWDQIRVKTFSICGVTMKSELKCYSNSDHSDIPEDLIVA